jgi:hypothetical protein
MARPVSLLQLRTRLEQRADIQNDQSVSLEEKNDLINEAITDLTDELVSSAPPDYFLTTATITTAADVLEYNVPDDFYKARSVQLDVGNQRRRGLSTMQPDMRIVLGPPDGEYTVYLEYIPTLPVLVDDADTIDGVNGWEELVVLTAALKVYAKKRLDPSFLIQQEQAARARVQKMAYRDAGAPVRIKRASMRDAVFPGWTQSLTHYRMRGDLIELYRVVPGYP